MRRRHYILLLFLLGSAVLSAQQLTPSSLFTENQTYFNPAANGNKEALTADFFTRQTWMGFEGAPSTQVFNVHAPLRNPKVALGLLVEHDVLGSTSYTGLHLNYAYRLSLGANTLSLGLRVGVNNGGQEIVGRDEMIDPAFLDENMRFWIPNFGFGALYYGKLYWAGISVPRILSYEGNASGNYGMSLYLAGLDYFLMGGVRYKASPGFGIEPSLMVKYNPSLYSSFGVNFLGVFKDRYKGGLGYRLNLGEKMNHAIIILLAMDINPQFGFGYSYDMDFGDASEDSYGSHELQIHYKFGYKVNASNPRGF